MKKNEILNCLLTLVIAVFFFSCNKEVNSNSKCPESIEIIDEFVSDKHYILTSTGKVFTKTDGNCEFLLQYFLPDFENNYFLQNDTIYTRIEQYPIPTVFELNDDFNNYKTFRDLFIISPSTSNRLWTDFVLLSPANPTISDYVAIRKCILGGTCDFDDNRIDIIADTISSSNYKLKFTAFAPVNGMVTSKSSIENTLFYANRNDEVIIEGNFFIEAGFPFSIIDFENKWFNEAPGFRLVFDTNKKLSVELKYGIKPWFRQKAGKEISFPTKEWVYIKAKFVLKDDESGEIKVWQNNELIIDEKGQTLPTSNSIQTSIETGVTATNVYTIMYLDNFRIKINKQ